MQYGGGGASTCSKLFDRLKSGKCGGGNIIKNCGLNVLIVLVWDKWENVAGRRMQKDMLPLQTCWRFQLMKKRPH